MVCLDYSNPELSSPIAIEQAAPSLHTHHREGGGMARVTTLFTSDSSSLIVRISTKTVPMQSKNVKNFSQEICFNAVCRVCTQIYIQMCVLLFLPAYSSSFENTVELVFLEVCMWERDRQSLSVCPCFLV